MQKIAKLLGRLLRNERGNVAAIFALSAVPVIGITGLAVDLGRAMQARTQVQAAVDAAAVTAVRLSGETEEQRIESAKRMFAANIASLSNSTISITPEVTLVDKMVTVKASGSVNTTTGAILGIPTLAISATSSVSMVSGSPGGNVIGSNQLELAMMIDLSGSMGDAKLSAVPYPAVYAPTTAEKGYWALRSYSSAGTPKYEWTTTGHYIPLYENLHLANTSQSCSTVGTSDPTGNLISCVTERTGPEDYSEASPSTAYVGAFNHGNTTVSNYSSDGSCWVAGRELPEVIPLTNDKSKLDDFFQNATFGGGTPGHLGTAWAWYTLSPKWSSVWPSESQPAAYGTQNVTKAAVIVTDGEYNMEYSSDTSRTQALALCKAMKDKGITIYTVGYGLSTSSSAGDSSADGKAKDLLTQCATSANHASFPYDGTALRQTLSDIGRAVKNTQSTQITRMTN